MKHIRRSKYCFCTVSVIIFTLWFSVSATTVEASESKPVKLKVTLMPFLSYAPFFIAQEEGYFAEQGLDVEFVKIKSSDMGVPLLLQGEVDITAASIRLNLLNAIARGGTLRIVADKGHVGPTGCTYTGVLLKGVRHYNQGKTERNLDILVKHLGLERELLQEVCWSPIHNDGHINFGSINDFQSWALDKGLLDSLITKEQFWDSSFIDYANQQLEASSK